MTNLVNKIEQHIFGFSSEKGIRCSRSSEPLFHFYRKKIVF